MAIIKSSGFINFNSYSSLEAGGDLAGHGPWLNPLNARVSDNVYTDSVFAKQVDNPANSHSDRLVGQELTQDFVFGFRLPRYAIILGIELAIERSFTENGAEIPVGHVEDVEIFIIKNNIIQTVQNKSAGAVWPSSDQVAVFGSPTDLWGVTWTPEEIDIGFGMSILALHKALFGAGVVVTARVDHMKANIHYDAVYDNGFFMG